MPLGSMTVRIAADIAQFNKDIASVQKTLNASTKGLQTVAKSMTSVGDSMTKGVTVPILAMGAGLLKLGNDFDNAYDKIRIGTGKTGKEFEGLQNDFKATAKVSASSFDDISTAITGYSKTLGLTDKPLQNLSTQILNVSRLTDTELNANVDESSKVLNNWKIATEDQSETLDMLFRASQNANISITDLMADVADSGQILRTMAYDIEDATALIAAFDVAGVDVSSTIAGMKKALVTMAQEGFTDPQEVLSMYIDKIKGAKTEVEAIGIAAELFGAKGGAAMAISIREGRLNLDDLVNSLKTGTDSINGAAAATDDWKEKLILLKNNLGIAIEPLATKVFDSVGRIIEGATPKIEGMATAFGKLTPEMQDNIILWASITMAIPAAISILGRAATGAIQLRNALITMNAAITASSFGGFGANIFQALTPIAGSLTAISAGILAIGQDSGVFLKVSENLKALKYELAGNFFINWLESYKDAQGYAQENPLYNPKTTFPAMREEAVNALTDISKASEETQLKAVALLQSYKEGKITIDDLVTGVIELGSATSGTTAATVETTAAWKEAATGMEAASTSMAGGKTVAEENTAAYVENEAAVVALMEKFPELTRVQAENQIATDKQRQATDDLRSSFNQLIDDIFGGITSYNDFEEANWAVEAAQKALKEATNKYGKSSQEAKQAQNDLDDAMITAIETAFNLSTEIGATTAQQEEARNKAVALGLQYVATGAISMQAFGDMAAKFGLTGAEIITMADAMNIKLDYVTRQRLLYLNTDAATRSAQEFQKALDNLTDKDIYITTYYKSVGSGMEAASQSALEELAKKNKKSMGGPVGFSGGGFLESLKNIQIPKFADGGVLAMLHPPEVVLNGKQALNMVWNQAQERKAVTESNSNQLIQIDNVIELDGEVIYQKTSKHQGQAVKLT